MKRTVTARKRVSLNLDPRVFRRMMDVITKMEPRSSKQRFIEEAIIQRLALEWRGV
jgi:hypothetical protein